MTQADIERTNRETAMNLVKELVPYLIELEAGKPTRRTTYKLSVFLGDAANAGRETDGAGWCWQLVEYLDRGEWAKAAADLRLLLEGLLHRNRIRADAQGRLYLAE